jgi:hypothetical protein
MCHYIDYTKKYNKCMAPLKYIISKQKYNKCNTAKATRYPCKDSKLVRG